MTQSLPYPSRHHMSADEATTVRQLAALTGFPVRRVVRLINRSLLAQIRFAVAVELATGEWDWLDGETGQWRTDGAKQQEKLHRYAISLTEEQGAPFTAGLRGAHA